MASTITPTPQRPTGKPWTFDDAAEFIGVSSRHLRRQADVGNLKTIYVGERRFIPDAEVRRLATEGTK